MKRQYPAWLESALIYNIYPQSFMDSNADGIGDLQGIVSRLDYIGRLGADVIWLNPIYDSPFRDAGYDVRDYLKIAPRYGTMDDLETLFLEAKKRGIRVVLDFVPGHTSDSHPWFTASAMDGRNEYSDRYIWSGSTFDTLPGTGNFVSGCFDRDAKYLPNFFPFQPALNWGCANPGEAWQLPVDHPSVTALRDEMLGILRFYLGLGAAGFRVDMASSLIKNDPDFAATGKLWQLIRSEIERDFPDAVLISEWSSPKHAIPAGFHVDFYIHFNTKGYSSLFRSDRGRNMIADSGHSWFDIEGKGEIRTFVNEFSEHHLATRGRGFISIPSGNHDMPRLNEQRTRGELETAFAFLLTMPGVPQLYYGDELGMKNVKGLVSKEGGYVRTQARTPMVWDASPNAGFSEAGAGELYLPVGEENAALNAESQENDGGSMLNFVRSLIALRRSHPALANSASWTPLVPREGSYPFAYLRSGGGKTVLVVLNPAGETRRGDFDIPLFRGTGRLLAGTACTVAAVRDAAGRDAVGIAAPETSWMICEMP